MGKLEAECLCRGIVVRKNSWKRIYPALMEKLKLEFDRFGLLIYDEKKPTMFRIQPNENCVFSEVADFAISKNMRAHWWCSSSVCLENSRAELNERFNAIKMPSTAVTFQGNRLETEILQRINPGWWLDGSVINGFCEYYIHRFAENNTVLIDQTIVCTAISENAIARLKVTANGKRRILVILNRESVHWSLAVFDLFSKEASHLDSLRDRNTNERSFEIARDNLNRILRVPFTTVDTSTYLQQQNGWDSGVFTLMSVASTITSTFKVPNFTVDHVDHFRKWMMTFVLDTSLPVMADLQFEQVVDENGVINLD